MRPARISPVGRTIVPVHGQGERMTYGLTRPTVLAGMGLGMGARRCRFSHGPYPDGSARRAFSSLTEKDEGREVFKLARSDDGYVFPELGSKLWTVPAARMKARKVHVVPLSLATVALLEALRPKECTSEQRVFAVAGVARSNMAMAMLLRRMGRGDITTHGFRSTFRDWAGDETEFASELIELALAHGIKDKAEAAYRRRTAITRRRELMEAWATYLGANDGPAT